MANQTRLSMGLPSTPSLNCIITLPP